MKRIICILFACTALALCTACGAAKEDTSGSNGQNGPEPLATDYKIAMLSDVMRDDQFLVQAYEALEAKADEYGFQWTHVECAALFDWEENAREVAEEGYDLLVGVGWQAGSAFSALAEEYPDTGFAVIDAVSENEKVRSLSFNTAEGCYVMGVMAGTAFPEESLFGYICNYQDQASYEYRYGFAKGIRAVLPEAEIRYNYANSYTDADIVYDLALQQQAAGCTFVFGGVTNSANEGIYQAALDLAERGTPIYTTGLSVDQTTSDNPYIIGGLTKQTDLCMERIIDEFMAGEFHGGAEILGVREGIFGVVGVTTNGYNYRNETIMTDEVLQAGHNALQDIMDGTVVLEVPMEGQ